MFKSYFKIGWRNLLKYKVYSFINIGGLALGTAVALLVGLWIHDELTFDRCHSHYDRLVMVMQHETSEGVKRTSEVIPMPLEQALRSEFGSDFEHLSLYSWPGDHILSAGTQVLSQTGNYVQKDFPAMISLDMLQGNYSSFHQPATILLSASAARALFGTTDVLDRTLRIDNKQDARVAGVYADLPGNSTFRDQKFFGSWDLYMAAEWPSGPSTNWNDNFIRLYAQLASHASLAEVSEKIKPVKANHLADRSRRPEIFLSAMRDWHLRSEWKNGIQTGGRLQQVWMVGTIGVFVLLLACINFMNLSTARSEKRSKEVGIRMAIGSIRRQLISQFLSESGLVVLISFGVAMLFAVWWLPAFNTLTGKNMAMPWDNPYFWGAGAALVVVMSLVAGSYPALYLFFQTAAGIARHVQARPPRRIAAKVPRRFSIYRIDPPRHRHTRGLPAGAVFHEPARGLRSARPHHSGNEVARFSWQARCIAKHAKAGRRHQRHGPGIEPRDRHLEQRQ